MAVNQLNLSFPLALREALGVPAGFWGVPGELRPPAAPGPAVIP